MSEWTTTVESDGMTLRDYFAAAALTALIPDCNRETWAEDAARESYRAADAMLKEREKQA
jgi:hypothetical protein